MITNLVLKYLATIKINFNKYLEYRVDFFLMTIAPSLIFFFIKYNLWSSIYNYTHLEIIKNHTLKQMLSYHALFLLASMLTKSNSSLDMAVEIRRGRISAYLLYPFNFYNFQFAQNLSFELLQVIICILTFIIFIYSGILTNISFTMFVNFIVYSLFVSCFWFNLQFMTGILAFWLEETWVIRIIINVFVTFFAGAMMPLEFFPLFLKKIILYTPFPYLGYYPVSYLNGRDVNLMHGAYIMSFWMLVVIIINRVLWKKGIKKYSGAGI